MAKFNIKRIFQIILAVCIVLTLLFIFIQSMLPPETSEKESNKVGDAVAEIIPPETKPGSFIQINLRKIAHFTEFALLSLFVSLYIIFYMPKIKSALLTLPLALFCAFIDETIQCFTGRGPSITDVWIDFSGFLIVSAVIYAIALAVVFLRRKIKGTEKDRCIW